MKQLQVEIFSFQVLRATEQLPKALIMNRLQFVSQPGTELSSLAQRAGNVTEEVTGSDLRLMTNLYDGEHTQLFSQQNDTLANFPLALLAGTNQWIAKATCKTSWFGVIRLVWVMILSQQFCKQTFWLRLIARCTKWSSIDSSGAQFKVHNVSLNIGC